MLLLENVRFHKGETKNDPAFAEQVSKSCNSNVRIPPLLKVRTNENVNSGAPVFCVLCIKISAVRAADHYAHILLKLGLDKEGFIVAVNMLSQNAICDSQNVHDWPRPFLYCIMPVTWYAFIDSS